MKVHRVTISFRNKRSIFFSAFCVRVFVSFDILALAESAVDEQEKEQKHQELFLQQFPLLETIGNELTSFHRLGGKKDPSDDCKFQFLASRDGSIEQFHELEMEGDNKMYPYPGMILEVLEKPYDRNADYGIETRSKGDMNIYHRYYCHGAISTTQNVADAKRYQLIEIIRDDLGSTDIHSHDFAYRPVFSLPFHKNGYKQWKDDGYWWDNKMHESNYRRMGHRAFAGGSHGEVWRAKRRCQPKMLNFKNSEASPNSNKDNLHRPKEPNICDEEEDLIMKRLMVGKSYKLMEAGLREIYFGDILARNDESKSLFTAYIDHFFHHKSGNDMENLELWIIFGNAGPSLRSLLYSPVENSSFLMYQHSAFWTKLRSGGYVSDIADDSLSTSVALFPSFPYMPGDRMYTKSNSNHQHINGKNILKTILFQLLSSASKLHERGIIHRDIKPSNIMCDIKQGFAHLVCRLGDFSSAYDDYAAEYLYSQGPSRSEQTDEYAPPEVLFGETEWIPFDDVKPESYDSWSIGVVILELLLGTPHVFSVDKRTTAVLTMKLKDEGANDQDIEKALYLAALAQFCIYKPTTASDWPLREGDPLFRATMAKTTCDINDFHNALRARDPLGIGFSDTMNPLLDLVSGLLAWNPKERLTAADALKHPYFDTGDKDGAKTTGTAVEPQMLDPKLDMNMKEEVPNVFTCPKCGRKFDNLQSCEMHTKSRNHDTFCSYDRSKLPKCLNAHPMLPSHPTSGYCDIQGRRPTIEDFHSVHLHHDHQFFGVFDGHNTNFASKYASSALYRRIVQPLSDIDRQIKPDFDWKSKVNEELSNAFIDLHAAYLEAMKNIPSKAMKKSGTTVTALFLTKKALVVASVGDSRAVLSIDASFNNTAVTTDALQLTVDHVASNPVERELVENRGAHISEQGGTLRVNGTLVITRSIGDAHLAHYLSRFPHVTSMTIEEVMEKCRSSTMTNFLQDDMPCFIILASDGLWDVFSNKEAVEMVQIILRSHGRNWKERGAMQEAAERLTQEAYVRGSTDNIGVCVVAVT